MRVAAAVWRREDEGPEKILARIERSLALCAREGVAVVVFPALIGCCFGDGAAFLERVRRLSAAYPELVLCPGSWWERAGGVWHATALLRGGEVLLRQRQLYLARWEREEGLARGEDLALVELGAEPGGWRTAIILSTDVFYPQVSRYAALAGADLVLSPVAIRAAEERADGGRNAEGAGPEGEACRSSEDFPRQLSGLWASVQANMFFAVESGFKGTFRGRAFASRSAIHAPLAMTPREDGFLALEGEAEACPEESGRSGRKESGCPGREGGGALSPPWRAEGEGSAPRSSPPVRGEFLSSREGEPELLVAELDPERRRAARRPFDPLRQLNPEAYRGLYLGPAGDPGDPRPGERQGR
ncbi:MAG: carbon-nitrogen hydrolase family protein [Bacillota bacterium]|nr:carbon-nitrogen hydrolase family protein [Bacillota bacterium]